MYEALFDHQLCIKPGMLVHVCNPRDWNVEEEGQQFNVVPPLHNKFEVIWDV